MFLTELLSDLKPATVQRIAKLETASNVTPLGGQCYSLNTVRNGQVVQARVKVALGLHCKLRARVEVLPFDIGAPVSDSKEEPEPVFKTDKTTASREVMTQCPDCGGGGRRCMAGCSAHPGNWYDCDTCAGEGHVTPQQRRAYLLHVGRYQDRP